MGRLIIVSNRVPDPSGSEQPGGLAVAVLDALQEKGGLWFGWSGAIARDSDPMNVRVKEHGNLTVATVSLRDGKFGNFDWAPVRYIHRSVVRDTSLVQGKSCRPRHPAARRNEPSRQGICCCAGRE
jgi:trehalose-6-phosphate synthase